MTAILQNGINLINGTHTLLYFIFQFLLYTYFCYKIHNKAEKYSLLSLLIVIEYFVEIVVLIFVCALDFVITDVGAFARAFRNTQDNQLFSLIVRILTNPV